MNFARRGAIAFGALGAFTACLQTGCGHGKRATAPMAQLLAQGQLHLSPQMPAYIASSIVPYAIGTETPFDKYPGTDWIERVSEPMWVEAGPRKIDACLLTETRTQLLFSVRATEMATPGSGTKAVLDWLNDLKASPVDSAHTGLPGVVHGGFWGSWSRLMDAGAVKMVMDKVQQTGKPLVLCGYSKGAAIAPMVAMTLLKHGLLPEQIEGVVLFEPARPGDAEFAKAYSSILGEKTLRYSYKDDVIPHLPPSKEVLDWLSKIPVIGKMLSELYGDISVWTPTAVGALHFIDWDGHIRTDTPELAKLRTEHLKKMILNLRFKEILNDHLPNAGFVKVLAPDRPCPWNFQLL